MGGTEIFFYFIS